jgi:hypothetical protein
LLFLIELFLATKALRHKENLIADYTDDTDLIGHKKTQKAQGKLATENPSTSLRAGSEYTEK